MRLIAIDPGKYAGWAFFEDGVIRECGLVCEHRKKDLLTQADQFWDLGNLYAPHAIVYEHATIYKGSDVDPQDVVNLAGLGGRLAGLCANASFRQCPIRHIQPRAWKGTIPKDVHNERTQAACPEARALLAHLPEGQHNHVWDAIGLGLWYLKRGRR